ncbi:MAG TPA: DUF2273 domain-containing protein [Firmicutes bacterium]|nr:DUF2273 domain-containing protein [Bacillota bacterium]
MELPREGSTRDELLRMLIQHRGKVLGSIFGFIVGLVVIFYGWFDAISLVICVSSGYFIGRQLDRHESFKELLERLLPPTER